MRLHARSCSAKLRGASAGSEACGASGGAEDVASALRDVESCSATCNQRHVFACNSNWHLVNKMRTTRSASLSRRGRFKKRVWLLDEGDPHSRPARALKL